MNAVIRQCGFVLLAVLLSSGVPTEEAVAQERPGEWAWRPIIEHEGVAFSYIYYPARDGADDSIVVRVINRNDHRVTYRFKIVFRSNDGAEHVESTEGDLAAGEAKTGALDELYWVPFSDGERISEVGLRGYEVVRQ